MKNYYYIILILISSLLFGACSNNDEVDDTGTVKAEFEINNIDQETLELTLNNISERGNANIECRWIWGDEEDPAIYEVDNNLTVSHQYAQPGTYNVNLQLYDLDKQIEVDNYPMTIEDIGGDVNADGIEINITNTNVSAWSYQLDWSYGEKSSIEHVKEMHLTLAKDADFQYLINPIKGEAPEAYKGEVEVEPSSGLTLQNLLGATNYYLKIRFVDVYNTESEKIIEFRTNEEEIPQLRITDYGNKITVFASSNNVIGGHNSEFYRYEFVPTIPLHKVSTSSDGSTVTYYKKVNSVVEFDVKEQAFNRETMSESIASAGYNSGEQTLFFDQSSNGPLTEQSFGKVYQAEGKYVIYLGDEENNTSLTAKGVYIEMGEMPEAESVLILNHQNTYIIDETTNGLKLPLGVATEGVTSFGLRILIVEGEVIEAAIENEVPTNGISYAHGLLFKDEASFPNYEISINDLLFRTR